MTENVREIVSRFLNNAIPPKGWNAVITDLDKQGRIGDKQVKGLLVIALKKIEQLEEEIFQLKNKQNSQSETIQTSTSEKQADLEPKISLPGTNNPPQTSI